LSTEKKVPIKKPDLPPPIKAVPLKKIFTMKETGKNKNG
jgi:hypothetical protein